jgi:hypothetical protein
MIPEQPQGWGSQQQEDFGEGIDHPQERADC